MIPAPLQALADRLRVIFGAVVTWLALAGVVVAIVVDELAEFADVGAVAWVLRILGVVAVVVATAARIIRRVTPVLPDERGILPPDGG